MTLDRLGALDYDTAAACLRPPCAACVYHRGGANWQKAIWVLTIGRSAAAGPAREQPEEYPGYSAIDKQQQCSQQQQPAAAGAAAGSSSRQHSSSKQSKNEIRRRSGVSSAQEIEIEQEIKREIEGDRAELGLEIEREVEWEI